MTPHPELADYREFMQDTDKSLERIIKTVEGLLALANLEEIQTDQQVEIAPLLSQAVKELAGQAGSKGVEISAVDRVDASVYGNASLLYRAFYNLIENAIKYNHSGGTVTVSVVKSGRVSVFK